MKTPILIRIRNLYRRVRSDPHVEGIFGTLAGVLLVLWLIEMALEFGTSVHWALGTFLTTFAGLFLAWAAVTTASFNRDDSIAIWFVLFAFSVLLGVVICSTVSHILDLQGWAAYEGGDPSDRSFQTFRRFYLWTLADMVPAINLWKTFPVAAPLTPADGVAGIPIFIFRLFVLGYVFRGLTSWWAPQHRDTGHA